MSEPTERRVADSLRAFADAVQPGTDGWERIDDRLGSASNGLGRGGPGSGNGSRRALLVAAAFVLVVLVVGAAAVQLRSDDSIEVATDPTAGDVAQPIVALSGDSRLVVLGVDGVERREITRAEGSDRFTGPVAVSAFTESAYLTRAPSPSVCGDGPENEVVEVPLSGGPQRVVGEGALPAVSPDGRRLASVVVPEPICGASPQAPRHVIEVRDLETGATVTIDPTELAGGAEIDVSYLMAFEWDDAGALLVLRPEMGSPVPDHALRPLTMFLDRYVVDLDTTPPTVSSSWRHQIPEETGGEAIVSFTPAGPSAPGTSRVVVAAQDDASDRVILRDATFTESGAEETGQSVVELGPLGLERGSTMQIDVDDAGRVLLPLIGAVAEPTTPPGTTGGTLPSGDPAIAWGAQAAQVTTKLVVWDGSGAQVVADGITAASWMPTLRVDPAPAPDAGDPTSPSTTVAPDQAAGTTVPPRTTGTPAPGVTMPGEPTVIPPSRRDDAQAVVDAYEGLFEGWDRTAFEGGPEWDPILDSGIGAAPGGAEGVTVDVSRVTFDGEDHADVRYVMAHPSWGSPVDLWGGAVRVDGRWLVSTDTMCTLLSRVNLTCPDG